MTNEGLELRHHRGEVPVLHVGTDLRELARTVGIGSPFGDAHLGRRVVPHGILFHVGGDAGQEFRQLGNAAVALKQNGECQQGAVFVAGARDVQVFGVAESSRVDTEQAEYFLLSLFLGFKHLHLFLGHEVDDAFVFQMREQVDVHDVTGRHVGNTKERQRRIGIFTGDFVTVVAGGFQHHVLAHEHACVDFEFALVVQYLAVETVAGLGQRATVLHLADEHLGSREERAFLRHAGDFV